MVHRAGSAEYRARHNERFALDPEISRRMLRENLARLQAQKAAREGTPPPAPEQIPDSPFATDESLLP